METVRESAQSSVTEVAWGGPDADRIGQLFDAGEIVRAARYLMQNTDQEIEDKRWTMLEKMFILSRKMAVEFSMSAVIPTCIIISIHSRYGTPNEFAPNEKIRDVEYFAFNDGQLGENTISEAQAGQMARFVICWADEVEAVVVHCDAGISRSAGIGAAIMKWADGDASEVLERASFRPNMKCYRLMLNAMMDIDGQRFR
jgi:predicted protein tyrosine phosphatase